MDLLENGQVDLIVTNFPNPRMNSVANVRQVKEFKDIFIASNQHFSYLKNKALRLEELLGYPLLMLDKNSMTSEFLHSLFQQKQLDLVPEIELSSNDLLIDLARIGLGIAFVPDFCLPENDPDLFQIHTTEIRHPDIWLLVTTIMYRFRRRPGILLKASSFYKSLTFYKH